MLDWYPKKFLSHNIDFHIIFDIPPTNWAFRVSLIQNVLVAWAAHTQMPALSINHFLWLSKAHNTTQPRDCCIKICYDLSDPLLCFTLSEIGIMMNIFQFFKKQSDSLIINLLLFAINCFFEMFDLILNSLAIQKPGFTIIQVAICDSIFTCK